MRLRNDQARQTVPTLVCLIAVTLSLPLGLAGCSEPTSSTTSGSTNGDGKTDGRGDGKVDGRDDGKAGGRDDGKTDQADQTKSSEEMFVTAAEEKRFVTDSPDTKVAFPEAEFVKGRKLIEQLKVAEAEKVLMSKVDDAVKSAAGETKLGQYCARISTALHMEGKEKESLKYAILAGHIFYKQPAEKRPLPRWFFNVHLHQGLGYKKLRMFPEAEKQLRKAINFASSAPAGQVDWNWHRLCLVELIDTLGHEKKTNEAKVVKGELKALEESHR